MALQAKAGSGIAVYSATKSAVDRLTRVAAMEAGKLGYGVRVNCVYPGLVPTAMGAQLADDVASIGLFGSPEEAVGAVVELTPAGRLGTVEDIADAVAFLSCDAARFITGAGLPVDGGMAAGIEQHRSKLSEPRDITGPRHMRSVTEIGLAAIYRAMAQAEAFIALYEHDAEAVLVFLTRRTLDAEVALELTAETFAQAWQGWPRVRADSREEVRAWLFTIARRQLGRYLRHGEVERRGLRRLGLALPTVHEDDLVDIERAAGVSVLRLALGPELKKLSAQQRDALQLRVVDELPYEQVAQRLGITQPTARARVSRGLRTLAAALEPIISQQEERAR